MKVYTHSSLKHSRQIANMLVRHGLDYLTGILGLERFVPFHKGLLSHPRRAEPSITALVHCLPFQKTPTGWRF